MKYQTLLQLFSSTLVLSFLTGCGNPSVAIETTIASTLEPPTITPMSVALAATPTAIPPSPAVDQANDVEFGTPEEAILHYFDGISQSDTRKILEACAINEMSENFNFALYVERSGSFRPMQSLYPSEYSLYVEANRMNLSEQRFAQVEIFASSLLSNEEVVSEMSIMMDEERANSFITDVDPARLAHMEVKKISLPNETSMNSSRYNENAAMLAGLYGADEMTERVVLFTFEQNDYYLGFTLLRYGETWKISAQISPLGGAIIEANGYGAPEETTMEEFEDMFSEK